ncbi:MAG: type II 3-dehydroquinate dehydratase [Candidatus Omnitrophica bacterium]|nr:type II 3-dehydroquinate dehydratase [Candidatus Omnitrophota bacterium]MBD3269658.1 type II 3-dehydroquinate dehydratase [Candidatus Omnitrophota bacterium]
MKPKSKILIIHGPNLHLLGKREPDIYGKLNLDEINHKLTRIAEDKGVELEIFQSNSEGEIVNTITKGNYDFLIINPAAYTHTSVAIRDSLLAVGKPAIEVHISNIYKREEFRKKSLVSDVVIGIISGLGALSYYLALQGASEYLDSNS